VIKLLEYGNGVLEGFVKKIKREMNIDGMQLKFVPRKRMTDAIFLVLQLQGTVSYIYL